MWRQHGPSVTPNCSYLVLLLLLSRALSLSALSFPPPSLTSARRRARSLSPSVGVAVVVGNVRDEAPRRSRSSSYRGNNGDDDVFALSAFFTDGELNVEQRGNERRRKNNQNSSSSVDVESSSAHYASFVDGASSAPSADSSLIEARRIKEEALTSARAVVSSLEAALASTTSELEAIKSTMNERVFELEGELADVRRDIDDSNLELEKVTDERDGFKKELLVTKEELGRTVDRVVMLEAELRKTKAGRPDEAETSRAVSVPAQVVAPKKKGAWKPWGGSTDSSVPVLNDWVVINGNEEGEVQMSGRVANHPSIADGDAIVTSPLVDASKVAEEGIVTTSSGSRYLLGTSMVMPFSGTTNENKKSTAAGNMKKKAVNSGGRRGAAAASVAAAAASPLSKSDPNLTLTGETIGKGRGKYLLAGKAIPNANGRSYVQTAYRSSATGNNNPVGIPVMIKVSSNKEAMAREYANYQKAGGRGDCFIKTIEFLPSADGEKRSGSTTTKSSSSSALIMQRGSMDVKGYMSDTTRCPGGRLEGEDLLQCAVTVLRCIEALHSARLVWNDLKTENFVVIEEGGGDDNDGEAGSGRTKISFRGIDLESCMPVKTNPVDYTPEACPPEFATSFLAGTPNEFVLEYSYDVWSYGMLLYEISTGRGYFDGRSAKKITELLPSFEPSVEGVEDGDLADLISRCLERNPRERPSLAKIRSHPYLAGALSRKSPFNFLFK